MHADEVGDAVVAAQRAPPQVPIWYVLSLGDTVQTIVVLSLGLGIGTWGMFGAQSAFMSELFSARQRYLGVSVAREISAVISGPKPSAATSTTLETPSTTPQRCRDTGTPCTPTEFLPRKNRTLPLRRLRVAAREDTIGHGPQDPSQQCNSLHCNE
ncbi:hypothetical protein [Arthrobacter sp. NicSoilC12]|uniref:hypothetical protein n=1 Tax=Arthrobacter sp. NicSoilC12 TaxID=2831001 RepID=UPI001CC66F6F|nr:hypothetical protein [Arthrobacter sp. NicSoilC12]GIU57749.1 hypothetical protein NicSoilC12_34980 [Arthrobacter sp. NicSoilC12]